MVLWTCSKSADRAGPAHPRRSDVRRTAARAGPPYRGPRLATQIEWVWLPDGRSDSPVAVTFGRAPAGHRVVEQYAVLPTARLPRLLVPIGSRRVAAATLTEYSGARSPRSRAGRRGLAAAAGAGLTRLLAASQLVVSIHQRVPRADWPQHLVVAHLAELLGVGHLHAFLTVRRINPNAKPTLELFDDDARPVAYAKLGPTEATQRLVRREAVTLRALAGGSGALVVPALLAAGDWHDTAYSVAAPLPRDLRRWSGGVQGTVPALEQVAASGDAHVGTFAGSAYLDEITADLAQVSGQPEVTHLLHEWLVALRSSTVPLPFGRMHGDWLPENLGDTGQRLAVWDWEHSRDHAPVGMDLLHWHFLRTLKAHGLLAAVKSVEGSTGELALLGVPATARPAVATAFLLDLFVRRTLLASGGGRWNDMWYPALLEVLNTRRPDAAWSAPMAQPRDTSL